MSHYTIKLRDGKYTVIREYTGPRPLRFLRHGEPWPAVDDLAWSNVVIAMAERIEELEMAIGQVLNGSIKANGFRYPDGMHPENPWAIRLRKALEQKE